MAEQASAPAPMTRINFDTAEVGDSTVLSIIHDNQGRLLKFEAEGPGGGNPNWTVEFPNDEKAEAFLDEIFDEVDLEAYRVK